MKMLRLFDEQNYDPNGPVIEREAARAIILADQKIALVRCLKEGYYKFPGGGIKPGETQYETLIRGTREEAGLNIIPESIREFGMVWEKRGSVFALKLYSQKSYYFLADVMNSGTQQTPGYEYEPGSVLEWADIEEAYRIDLKLGAHGQPAFVLREAFILSQLLEQKDGADAAIKR
jgi:8-oxo-dGTP pyrophosphatase MutT (NUDIX family)